MTDECVMIDANVSLMHIVHCNLAQVIEQWITSEEQHIQNVIAINYLLWTFPVFPDFLATLRTLIQKTKEYHLF